MYTNPLNTIEDAYEVIRRYGLERADFGGGTAEGFAAWLFVPGNALADVTVLAMELERYRNDFAEHARIGRNLDERLAGDAANLARALKEHTEARRELAELIRSVKFGEYGALVWPTIAELATTPARGRQAVNESVRPLRPLIAAVLRGLREYEECFDDSRGLHYEPGNDGYLDLMIRMDIERLDVTLSEAPPWAGKEPEASYELCALYSLASTDEVAQSLDPTKS
jgi:hypothetical protein